MRVATEGEDLPQGRTISSDTIADPIVAHLYRRIWREDLADWAENVVMGGESAESGTRPIRRSLPDDGGLSCGFWACFGGSPGTPPPARYTAPGKCRCLREEGPVVGSSFDLHPGQPWQFLGV